MIHFQDQTFCDHYKGCRHAQPGKCHRPLTPEVREAADKWWGKPGAPICRYGERPDCYETEADPKG